MTPALTHRQNTRRTSHADNRDPATIELPGTNVEIPAGAVACIDDQKYAITRIEKEETSFDHPTHYDTDAAIPQNHPVAPDTDTKTTATLYLAAHNGGDDHRLTFSAPGEYVTEGGQGVPALKDSRITFNTTDPDVRARHSSIESISFEAGPLVEYERPSEQTDTEDADGEDPRNKSKSSSIYVADTYVDEYDTKRAKIAGNTYAAKEIIKSDWETTHHEWDEPGQVWHVDADALDELESWLQDAGFTVNF